MKRLKKRSRFDSAGANVRLRAATVHLEEAIWRAKKRNCERALTELVEGTYELGVGRQAQGSDLLTSDGLAQMRNEAEKLIRKWCLR